MQEQKHCEKPPSSKKTSPKSREDMSEDKTALSFNSLHRVVCGERDQDLVSLVIIQQRDVFVF